MISSSLRLVLKCEFDADVKTEKILCHHDGEQLGFYKKGSHHDGEQLGFYKKGTSQNTEQKEQCSCDLHVARN